MNSAALLTLNSILSVDNWTVLLNVLNPGAHVVAICVDGSYHRIVNVRYWAAVSYLLPLAGFNPKWSQGASKRSCWTPM